jgi:hypothetical protein
VAAHPSRARFGGVADRSIGRDEYRSIDLPGTKHCLTRAQYPLGDAGMASIQIRHAAWETGQWINPRLKVGRPGGPWECLRWP